MAQSKPILYSYFRSSCSWRVRIAMAHKGIDYEYRPVNLLKGEHKTEDYLKLNACGLVPVLIDQGKPIASSSAILEYLEETAPTNPLLPKDPLDRSQVRAIVDGIVAGIQPIQNMGVLQYIGNAEESQRWARHWIESGFRSIERMLQDTHGAYCFGDTVTMADVCLVPQIYNANRFEVDMGQFPLISEISTRLNTLKAFKDTHPHCQPDTPDKFKAAN